MSPLEYEEIDLVFRFVDFDPEAEDIDDMVDPCSSPVAVTRLGEDLFQVYQPTSLTPFGPFGFFLGPGTKIRVKKLKSGSYRLTEIQEFQGVWSWQFHTGYEWLGRNDVMEALEELSELGCRWEFCAGNLTIQCFRQPDEASPSPALIEKIAALQDRIIPASERGP